MRVDSYERLHEDGFKEIDQTGYSAYSGSIVQMSNFKVLQARLEKHFPETIAFAEGYGWYDSTAIFVNRELLTKEEREYLEEVEDELEGYPILDEDHANELEWSMLTEFIDAEAESELLCYAKTKDCSIWDLKQTEQIESMKEEVQSIAMGAGVLYIEAPGCIYCDWDSVFDEYFEDHDLYDFVEVLD